MPIDIELKQDWCKNCDNPQPQPCLILVEGPIDLDCLVEKLLSFSSFTNALKERDYTNECCEG